MVDVADPEQLANPANIVDEITKDLDAIHQEFVHLGVQVGYARDHVLSTRNVWDELHDLGVQNLKDALPMYISGVGTLTAVRDGIRGLRQQVQSSAPTAHWLLNASIGTVSIAASTASLAEGVTVTLDSLLQPPVDLERFGLYAERFDRFDPDLGRTYRAIVEALYGTRSDPERSALYLMRQAFDHLFDRLSPDADVVDWLRQTGSLTDQITRRQRIEYAALHHVKDKVRAKTLEQMSKHTKDVYDALQYAHIRGSLDRQRARTALEEMQKTLEQWADALEL